MCIRDRINPMDVHEPQLLQVVTAYRLFMPLSLIHIFVRLNGELADDVLKKAVEDQDYKVLDIQ